MDKFKLLKNLIEENDKELKETEDKLVEKVNIAYEKAIKGAIKEFKELEKLDPKYKVSSSEVQEILEKTIKAFKGEFETIVGPYREELVNNYERSLSEASIFLAAVDKYLEKK